MNLIRVNRVFSCAVQVTYKVIKANNVQAQAWSTSIEPEIDKMLTEKRKELIDFYS